jgi:predicted ATP-grasp superfamily ATP-dependent carboligase
VPGALVLGGDYRALGVVRSLGRRGIPVWVLHGPDDHSLAATSRYNRGRVRWEDGDDDIRTHFLLDLAERHDLGGWALFPTADATAAFVARCHEGLRDTFRLTTPPWDVFRWAYDKRLTAELAASLGIGHPATRTVASRADVESYDGAYPVILKPATKPRLNMPAAKAWRADDPAGLLLRYDEAAALTEPGTLMLQELIPGRRGAQLSFAALSERGTPLAWVTAERVRQHPMDFGRSSTLVVTITNDDVEELGRRVLAALGLTGLAEVEFKRDDRDGSYRLLDINVRVWGWHTIGRRVGLDFAFLAWRQALGANVPVVQGPVGLRWLRMTTDLPVAVGEVAGRRLSPASYLGSVLARHERAVFAGDDPLPGALEVPLFAVSAVGRRLAGRFPAGNRTRGTVPPAAEHNPALE